ncbi:MAG: DUF11 domain-containing protein [Planctomycetes bacterium]|nr:DUF11 domain-containing protein [Planctomycetota bacterium]
MIYTIVIKNHGSSPAREVVVEDRVPANVELVGTIPQAELHGNRLVWKLGSLPPGAEKKISVKVIPKAEGQVGSVATVSFVAEVAAATKVTQPKLHFEVSGPKKVKLGEQVTLKFFVRNEGTADATGVVLRDIIPPELKHPDGNDLEYEVGTLPPGESRTIQLTLAAEKPGKAVNQAIMTADGGVLLKRQAEIKVIGQVIQVKRSGPTRLFVDRPTRLVYAVRNVIDEPIHSVNLSVTLPQGLDFLNASDGGLFDRDSRTVSWLLESIPGQGQVEVSLELIARRTGTFRLTAAAHHRETKSNAQQADELPAVAFAALTIQTEGMDRPLRPAERRAIQIRVRNLGPSPARNVRVRVTASGGIRAESAEAAGETNGNDGLIRFAPVPELRDGAAIQLPLVLHGTDEGAGRLRIEVEADGLGRPLVREESIAVFSDQ